MSLVIKSSRMNGDPAASKAATHAHLSNASSIQQQLKDANLSPLSLHCHINDLDKIKDLVENHKADIEARDSLQFTPLHYSVWNNHLQVTQYLIEQGAQLESLGDGNRTPLHLCAQNNCAEIAEVLIEAGARIDAEDEAHRTPLWYAQTNNFSQVTQVLKEGYPGALRRMREKAKKETQLLKKQVKSLKTDLQNKAKLMANTEDVNAMKRLKKKADEDSLKLKSELQVLQDQVEEMKKEHSLVMKQQSEKVSELMEEVSPKTIEHLLDQYQDVHQCRLRDAANDAQELELFNKVDAMMESFEPFQGLEDVLNQATLLEVEFKKSLDAIKTVSPEKYHDRLADTKNQVLENMYLFSNEKAEFIQELKEGRLEVVGRLEMMQDVYEVYRDTYNLGDTKPVSSLQVLLPEASSLISLSIQQVKGDENRGQVDLSDSNPESNEELSSLAFSISEDSVDEEEADVPEMNQVEETVHKEHVRPVQPVGAVMVQRKSILRTGRKPPSRDTLDKVPTAVYPQSNDKSLPTQRKKPTALYEGLENRSKRYKTKSLQLSEEAAARMAQCSFYRSAASQKSLMDGIYSSLEVFRKWKVSRQTELQRLEKVTNELCKSLSDELSNILLGGCSDLDSETMKFRIRHCLSIQKDVIQALHDEKQTRSRFDPPHASILEGLKLMCQLDYRSILQIQDMLTVYKKLREAGHQWKRTEFQANDFRFNELYKQQKESRKRMMYAKIEEEDDLFASASEKKSKQQAKAEAVKEYREMADLVEDEMFKLKSLSNSLYPELAIKLPWLSSIDYVSRHSGVFHRVLDQYDILETLPSSNNTPMLKASYQNHVCLLRKIKELHGEQDRAQFVMSCRRQLSIEHPHIVQPELFFINDKNIGFVQYPLYKHGDLGHYLKTQDWLTQAQLQDLLKDALLGLLFYEQHDMIHGDIRPQTIIINNEKKAQIDYNYSYSDTHGIMAHPSHLLQSTIAFMAPEVLRAQLYSNKSDIYSLGLVAFDMHFPSEKASSTAQAGIRESFLLVDKSHSMVIPDHSCADLSDLLRKMLQVDPCKRISASEALQHPYFSIRFGASDKGKKSSSQEPQLKCGMCFQVEKASFGILCESMDHFVCKTCLQELVQSMCKTDPNVLGEYDGAIACPLKECGGKSFTLNAMVRCLDPVIFDEYLCWRSDVKEHALPRQILGSSELTHRSPIVPKPDADVDVHMNYIHDMWSQVHCPRCFTPHYSFAGHLVLQCLTCTCSFCGLCKKECGLGKKGQEHIQHCLQIHQVHSTSLTPALSMNEYHVFQHKIQSQLVHRYVESLPENTRALLLAKLHKV